MNVVLIVGHPRSPSLCAALAEAYAEGARAARINVETVDLASLRFDPDVHTVSPNDQELEPELEHARRLLVWADHLVFVYPGWWGVGPARLKGFLDRILLPGFAFRERNDGRLEGMLGGRTAHLITTMDMPPWVYRLIYRAPGYHAMKRSTLGFCGIETTRTLLLGPVRESDPTRRSRWMEKARQLGFSLGRGARSPIGQVRRKILAWIKALRLQFYPMSWAAYTIGALGAAGSDVLRNSIAYWLGYGLVFFSKAGAVFVNEWFDYDSDRRNEHAGWFNGGSRVLVNGEMHRSELRRGIVVVLLAAVLCAALLLGRMGTLPLVAVLTATLVLGLGYTAPPLKLSWRGLGELNVALTHSVMVIMLGYLLQGGTWSDPFPWLIGLPLFAAILPSIILSGVPDVAADREAGKRTLVVRMGVQRVLPLAAGLCAVAPLLVVLLRDLPGLQASFDGLIVWALPHALVLMALILRYWRQGAPAGRLDGLMLASLSYIVWFALFPLLNLW